ncbi:MAG: aminotransferase class III-fold pyridoxal phosphate-dependent enzyme [Myxococcota bacterium]|nr:aminotransferase class III-fold pyridoxal phosphate-dependent enzyme [Myxococcota bacterium]
MQTEEIIEKCKRHTLYTWAAQGNVRPFPIERAEGSYIYDTHGKEYLDFNSQLMSVNIGHSHPKVVKAIQEAAAGLIYTFPGSATEARAALGERLAALLPGDLNVSFFTLGGAEANENAIKIARQYTGKHKILSRYRSYHGATHACMQMTGDPRRWSNEPGAPGFIRVMDPQPYNFSFGEDDATKTEQNLRYLEEVIQYENPDSIAAMFIETVTGTNGVLPPPEGYLQGLRKLLDKYNILLVCDEVMAGFGRTGKMFAFEHAGIVPDIVTMAKGLTSSYIPLGAAVVRDDIANYFRDNVLPCGLTYNSHNLALNTAMAVLDVFEEEKLADNAQALGAVMQEEMQRLQEKHPCINETRNIGLFGMIDLGDGEGNLLVPYNGSHPVIADFNGFLRAEGLFTFIRWGHIMCNPPLCTTEDQLRKGFDIIDRGLDLIDAVLPSKA